MEKQLEKDLNSFLNPFKEKEEPKTVISSGIYKAKAFFEKMKHSFVHGKRRGETTRFASIDPQFTWKKGFVHCWTGYPNHGKTEMLLQLSIAKSLHDNWNWVIFCPENMSSDETGTLTPDEIFDTLIHAYIGKSVDPYYRTAQMSMEEYEKGLQFIDKHYTIIYPNELKTPATVIKYLQHVIDSGKIDGVILDPWNKMVHSYSGLLDEYLAGQFAIIKDFAIRNHIVFNIVEHPKSVMKLQDGSLPVPDAYSLRGGAMWNNAMDVIISVHRPNYQQDKKDQAVDFISHKIKNQKLVGMPGTVNLQFDRKSNRYFEMNGNSPLHVIEMIEEQKDNLRKFIPTDFYEKDRDETAPF